MKRIMFTLMVFALIATPCLAGPTFQFSLSEALSFQILTPPTTAITSSPGSAYGVLAISTGSSYSDLTTPLTGDVGYAVSNVSTGDYIALGTTVDLQSKSSIGLTVHNDNQQNWSYALWANDGTTNTTISDWTAIAPWGGNAYLTLNISTLTPTGTDTVALLIRNDSGQIDKFHASVTIPPPGTIILGSVGVGIVGWLRKNRTF
ncbi:MAG: hypothetical protein IIC00_10590 [Planctomycetes bacterium]|nr:hypothetical protein [Planctomycetota bacterium]